MILVRLVRVRLFADGGGGKAKACHPLLDSNQEHYSIEIASNYYISKSSSLIVISKNITCLMGLGGIGWQNIRLLGESLRRLKR